MAARRREVDIMCCARCNRDKAWADGFPDRIYAVCWLCYWKQHQEEAHKPMVLSRRWWQIRAKEAVKRDG